MTTLALPASSAIAARLAGSPLLVMLDVDGTLAPIAPTPDAAKVPERTRRAVDELARRSDVRLVLVSGRAAEDARRMVAVSRIWILGNHGMERLDPAGHRQVNPAVAPYEGAVTRAAVALSHETASIPGVIVEDKRLTLSVHYRLADGSIVPRLRQHVEHAAAVEGLRLTEGKKLFELRPPVRVHKGTAILELAHELGVDRRRGSLLYAGDDRTDEDAFELLRADMPAAVTVRVAGEPLPGGAATHAEFTVSDTEELRQLLEWLAETRTSR